MADLGQPLFSFHKCRGETQDISFIQQTNSLQSQVVDGVINVIPLLVLSQVSLAMDNSQILLQASYSRKVNCKI
jgi:hypothetical protein